MANIWCELQYEIRLLRKINRANKTLMNVED